MGSPSPPPLANAEATAAAAPTPGEKALKELLEAAEWKETPSLELSAVAGHGTTADSDQCEPKADYGSIGTTSGNSDSLGSHFTFAVKSAIAAGTTGNEACKALAALTLNELAERYR